MDSSFEHYWQYDKCVNFICDAYVDLSNSDIFGLMSLGDESHNILLEEKACNSSVKKLILNSLKKSIEDSHFQRRKIDFKKALDQAIQATALVSVSKVIHKNLTFYSPTRWVICLLGSLRSLRNFDGIRTDSSVNLLIVCLTND